MSLYHDVDLSLQLNISSVKVKNNTINMWVREDRKVEFSGSAGLPGNTLISRITIDCNSLYSVVEEQRTFDKWMSHKSTSVNDDTSLKEPTELMSAISAITLCGDGNKTDSLPIKQTALSVSV
jgi:hypothetical protein